MADDAYKIAYERERTARLAAEKLLDEKIKEVASSMTMVTQQFDTLMEQKRELELLMTVANFSQQQLSFSKALSEFISVLGDGTQAAYIIVYLFNSKTNNLKASDIRWATDEFPKPLAELVAENEYACGNSIPGKVLQTGKDLKWCGEAEIAPKRVAIREQISTAGCYAVPIKRYGHVVAVIEIGVHSWENFPERLLKIVNSAALQLGVTLERRDAQKNTEKNLSKLRKAHDDLKHTQSQLVQSEKMASLGQLSAGVAHEINNPIGFVMSNIETMKDYASVFERIIKEYAELEKILPKELSNEMKKKLNDISEIKEEEDLEFLLEDICQMVSDSEEGLKRVKDIVANLKNFSRADEDGKLEPKDVNECIDNTLKIIWNEIKYTCEVVKNYGEIPLLNINEGQIGQVFMNLLINASHACQKNGLITITTKVHNENAVFIVEDNGSGIEAEKLSKIFDPFYTTKAVGVGTGLGLSISYGIIEKHKGKIEVESTPGKGTKFTIVLPIPVS
ncbi:GAF domain-containing sensor histidine kinase [Aliikangiella coralliicola]|uniref:histidine kinase n=1 Tax=Aliikangiella coralliicola TaxID=2592383 RepID=A0A545UDQ0_9GAMM|nr:ATP-binding protein [Aliikangiella coralliicola]TQV87596.1 GHKL domain-containing protein [Aliikangiella coralliicola]